MSENFYSEAWGQIPPCALKTSRDFGSCLSVSFNSAYSWFRYYARSPTAITPQTGASWILELHGLPPSRPHLHYEKQRRCGPVGAGTP